MAAVQEITLYELYWSHYCEKVRWALDYKGLPWRSVKINAFSKREMRRYPAGPRSIRLVPMVVIPESGQVIYESSDIMQCLDLIYSDTPRLFPLGDVKEVMQKIIEFDNAIGLAARRLGYLQLILECPAILAELFLGNQWKGVFTWPGIRRIASVIVAMVLLKRFNIHRSEDIFLYETTEAYLLQLAEYMRGRSFVIGGSFTAADITLACHLRPLRIIPFFFDNLLLQELFVWQEQIMRAHGRPPTLPYEDAIGQSRRERPPVRRKLRAVVVNAIPSSTGIYIINDQQRIWTREFLRAPYWYFRKIWVSKVRQWRATADIR